MAAPTYKVPLTVVKDGNTGLYSLIDAKGTVLVTPRESAGEVLSRAITFNGIPRNDLPLPAENIETVKDVTVQPAVLSTSEKLVGESAKIAAEYRAGQDLAAVQLIQAQGVKVPDGKQLEYTINEKNGITTIEVVGGKTIKIPADEFNTLVTRQRLDGQESSNKLQAYEAWQNLNPQYGEPGSLKSTSAFEAADAESLYVNGYGLYPRAIDPAIVEQANAITQKYRVFEPIVSIEVQPSKIVDAIDLTATAGKPVNKDDAAKIESSAIATNKPPVTTSSLVANSTTVVTSTGVGTTSNVAFQTSTADSPNAKPSSSSITITADSSNAKGVQTPAGKAEDSLRPNLLDAFDSYTYGISLHLIPNAGTFNAIMSSGKVSTSSIETLVSAGGGGKRNKNFNENFYFDELNMRTLIGLNTGQSASNAIEINFTLIEPMGLSFLDRLVATCADFKVANHLTMPYLLEINFFDSERGRIGSCQKWIPIQLLEVKIKITTRGTEYRFKAAPYVHSALTQTVLSTPANFNVSALSVDHFFRRTEGTVTPAGLASTAQSREDFNAAVANGTAPNARVPDGSTPTTVEASYASIEKVYSVNSYVDAYNFWMQNVAKRSYAAAGQATQPDSSQAINDIKVEISPVFLGNDDGFIVDANKVDYKATPMAVPDSSRVRPLPLPNTNMMEFPIRAGTLVTHVISSVMQQTKYIQKQFVDPTPAGSAPSAGTSKSLNWFRIIPSIKLKTLHQLTNQWTYTVTYNVVPYRVDSAKHPLAPKPEQLQQKQAVKAYQYLYTGQNTSVIELALDFDMTYYTAVTVNMTKSQIVGDRKAPGEATDESKLSTDSGRSGSNTTPGAVRPPWMPLQFGFRSETGTGNSFNKRMDPRSTIADSVGESLYSGMHGDMLTIKMRINGDPDFIKQDEILVTPQAVANSASDKTYGIAAYGLDGTYPNNSLVMDTGEVIIGIKILMPFDYDESTGETQFLGTSGFSGLYRVLNVDNSFKGGKFEQTLECVRYFNQADQVAPSSDNGAFSRKDAVTTVSELTSGGGTSLASTTLINSNFQSGANNVADDIANYLSTRISQALAANKNSTGGTTGTESLLVPNNWAGTDQNILPAQPGDIQTV